MNFNRMTAGVFADQLKGAPVDGEFRKQALAPSSFIGDTFYALLNDPDAKLVLGAVGTIAVTLLRYKSRGATKTQILVDVRKLPCIERMQSSGTRPEQEIANELLEASSKYLDEELLNFDVNFPPEDYRELRPQPRLGQCKMGSTAMDRWMAKIGLEMKEEQHDPDNEVRYHYDFGFLFDWAEQFDDEYDQRRTRGTRLTPYVFVLSPSQENVILRPWYQSLCEVRNMPQSLGRLPNGVELNTTSDAEPSRSLTPRPADFCSLPNELKLRILRLILLFPGKLRVTSEVTDDGTNPELFIDTLPATSYRFGLAFKVPKFMLPNQTSSGHTYSNGYYSSLENTGSLLAVLEINKSLHKMGKEIFYGENYFEALDDCLDVWLQHRVSDPATSGEQSTHRWLELMSVSQFRGGCLSYGAPPLTCIRKLNVDLGIMQDSGNNFGQIEWHFD